MESSNSIDVKVISCTDLKSFNFFQKLSVYSVVSLATADDRKSKRHQPQKTPVDRHGDRNPSWNHEIRFDLDPIPAPQRDLLFLHFDLFSDGTLFPDRLLGDVHVPLADLARDLSSAVRFVSYQIRSPDRKPNGVLNFSYKVNSNSTGKIASYPTVDTSPAVLIPAHEATPGGHPYYHPPPVLLQYHPPPPPPAVSYYPQPGPVGFAMRPPGGLGYGSYAYPTVAGARPCNGDTWRGGF